MTVKEGLLTKLDNLDGEIASTLLAALYCAIHLKETLADQCKEYGVDTIPVELINEIEAVSSYFPYEELAYRLSSTRLYQLFVEPIS